MSEAPAAGQIQAERPLETVNLEAGDWEELPEVAVATFDQAATLGIARWILVIFSGVYVLSFAVGFIAIFSSDATSEQIFEFARFMLTSVLPIVTLAVGYYLGDKSARSGG